MDKSVLACTAHRPDRLPAQSFILVQAVKDFFEETQNKWSSLWAGGQMGGDLYCSLSALSFNIDLHLCLPFPAQIFTARWPTQSDKDRLAKLMKAAKTVHFISNRYSRDAFLERNKFIIDRADEVFAVFDGQRYGGTYHAVSYARERGLPVTILDPNTLAIRREE